MVNTLTDVQIFNQALLRLGQTAYFVTAVDGTDTGKYGTLAYPLYYLTRDEELRSGTWKVAKKRAQLSPANVTVSSTWTSGNTTILVTSTVGILPGWLVTNAIIQGGGVASVPAGIQAGT